MKNFTSAQIIEALTKIGIVHNSYSITKIEVLNYFNEKNTNNNDKYSNSVIVYFFKSLGLDYSEFIDCNRNGLLAYFDNNVSIDGNDSSGNIVRKFINYFFSKKLLTNKKNTLISYKDKTEDIKSFFDKLIELNEIEILKPLEYNDVSRDKKFSYINSKDGKKLVDVTITDDIWLTFYKKEVCTKLFFLTEKNNDKPGKLVGYGQFITKKDNNTDNNKYYLEILEENSSIDFSKNNRAYMIVFSNYNQARWYATSIDIVSNELEKDEIRVLCIDFGTSNTSVGTWIDYKNPEPKLVEFEDITDSNNLKISFLLPSTVYIQNIETIGNNKYKTKMLFGFKAINYLKEKDYSPKGSYFINIKQWLSAKDDFEIRCKDESEHDIKLPAKDIIASYLDYVIKVAQIKFKKHFVKLHFSAPVKLKSRFNELVKSVFNEENGHKVISASDSLDEGLAIIYNYISALRYEFDNPDKNIEPDGKVMIIDCGGGTTDIASCKYHFEKSNTGINAIITTKFENGFNLGGNDLTYLIFQLLKIRLSEYYSGKTEKFSLEKNLNIKSDNYLEEIDSCIENKRPFDIYQKLDEASYEAEWVVPTDFNNDKYVTGAGFYNIAHRNFIYLWDWAEKIKLEFFTNYERAIFNFVKEVNVKKDKMYFYVDINGKKNNSKSSDLKKREDVPDIEINVKELAILLSPMIYYILSLAMPSSEKLEDLILCLSGQSSKISLFRELLKEFICGKRTRGKLNTSTDPNDKKLSCVKGCIQYFKEDQFGELNTSLKIDTPNIPYTVKVNNFGEPILDGTKIKTLEDGISIIPRIKIIRRPLKNGSVSFIVTNKSYEKDIIEYDSGIDNDDIVIKTQLDVARKLDSLSELINDIKDISLKDIDKYYFEEDDDNNKSDKISSDTMLQRLEKDLLAEKVDENGEILIFAVPNNDGCGFVFYQVAKIVRNGSSLYYLTSKDRRYYEKVEKSMKIFDGKNCK